MNVNKDAFEPQYNRLLGFIEKLENIQNQIENL